MKQGRPLPPDPPTLPVTVPDVPQEKAHLFGIWLIAQQEKAQEAESGCRERTTPTVTPAEVFVALIDEVTQRDLGLEEIEWHLRDYRRSQEYRRQQQAQPEPD